MKLEMKLELQLLELMRVRQHCGQCSLWLVEVEVQR